MPENSVRYTRILAACFMTLSACGGGIAATSPKRATPPQVAVTPAPSLSAPVGPTKPAYPPTPKQPVIDVYQDVRVTDDYRWLEDWSDPKVQAWSEAENTFARTWLDAVPGRAALRARLEQLMGHPSPSWRQFTARRGAYFALEQRPPKQQPYLVVLSSLDDAKSARVLVDPAVLDTGGRTSIDWYVPSPDGKRVAVALSAGGREQGDVHVFDVATGAEAKDVVAQAGGAGSGNCLAWTGDGSGFFYTLGRPDGATKSAYRHINFHKLGEMADHDAPVLGQDGSRIAQWEVTTGGDGRTILARVEEGDSGAWEHWLLAASGKWVRIATRADDVKITSVAPGGSVYLLSAKDAPKRKVLRTSATSPSLAKAQVVVPEGDAVVSELLPTKSRLYLVEDVGGISRVRSVPSQDGKASGPTILDAPTVSRLGGLQPLGGDDVAFAALSFTQPWTLYRVSGKDGTVNRTAFEATTAGDFSAVDVAREQCSSKDGTKVPITVVRARSTPVDGSAPALMTGYGAYGTSNLPVFRPDLLAWLEQGGVYAVANIRGGGELGEAWHAAGNLTNKQNGIDDFYACAQHLVDARYTTNARLAIQGRSAGGILMGAELTQHPEAFKAVVSSVGVYDMLRVERDSNGAFNVTEFGTVSDPRQLAAMVAYSPYHHAKDGAAYPAALFMTGANDPRVAPYHSRKMVARLQDATSSEAPILLRTSANTGHGSSTPLDAQIEEATDVYGFLFRELGMTYAAR
jgi:prolyl oligopeptidase